MIRPGHPRVPGQRSISVSHAISAIKFSTRAQGQAAGDDHLQSRSVRSAPTARIITRSVVIVRSGF